MIKRFNQFVNEDIDHAFKPNNDKEFDKADLVEQDPGKEKELEANFKKSLELFKAEPDNTVLKMYTLVELAVWLLSKTSQLDGDNISDDIDYLASLIVSVENGKKTLEEVMDKAKATYKKVYDYLGKNDKTQGDFSAYEKDLQLK